MITARPHSWEKAEPDNVRFSDSKSSGLLSWQRIKYSSWGKDCAEITLKFYLELRTSTAHARIQLKLF